MISTIIFDYNHYSRNETTIPIFKFDEILLPIDVRATSQAPKRQARRGSQLVLTNLLTFLFQHLSSDL